MIRGLLALSLAAALLAGCTDEPSPGTEAEPTGPAATTSTAADDGTRDEIEALLRRRARAIEQGDGRAFAATAVPGPARRAQVADLVALADFPVGTVAYRLGMHDPSVEGDRYRADVEMLVGLDGFDTAPVPTEHRLDFRRTPQGWRVVRDRVDRSQLGFAPWLLPGHEVYVSDDLVAVFDGGSAAQRDRFARIAEDAIRQVQADVPTDWSGRAVVLAPSETDTLRYEGFDPAEIGNLGGVAYPVRGPDQQVTGRRIVIAPVMLTADDRALSTVLRHELAHTALVDRDDPDDTEVPVWVREGLAEYVAHLGDDIYYIDPGAVRAAQAGIDQMPPDGLFHSGDWGPSYGVAWFSMLAIASRSGDPDEPFDLLEAIREEEPADFREVSALLEERYGLTTDELAAQAGELIDATFD